MGGHIMKKYTIQNNIPTLEEYKYLCDSVGWTDYMNFEVAEESLKNSIYDNRKNACDFSHEMNCGFFVSYKDFYSLIKKDILLKKEGGERK